MSFQSFSKKEHLKSRKQIQMLFQSGKAFSVFPYRVIYSLNPASSHLGIAKVGFTVPLRNFKHAVDRNRMKRQMREAYRLQKKELIALLKEHQLELHIFFIYTDKKLPKYSFLSEKMDISLNKLLKKLLKMQRHIHEKGQ